MTVRALADRFDSFVNPIALKELRQAVRGRFVASMLVLCLVGFVIAIAVFVVAQQFDSSTIERSAVGPAAFMSLYMVVFTASVFFIPLYTGLRMMAEHAPSNVDLLFITTLRPRTIVFGKLQSAATLTALLFSAALPFLIFCYVLRGIDFISIVVLSAFAFIIVVSQSVLGLFVGSLPASKPFKLLLAIILFSFTSGVYSPIIAMSRRFLGGGASFTSRAQFVQMTLLLFGALIAINVLLLVLSIAIITPPTANRALPIRILLSVFWVIGYALAVWGAIRMKNVMPLNVWAVAALSLASFVMLSAIGEREEWGHRVARTIPTAPLLRIVAFLFYSGGGGVLWAIVVMVLTIVAYTSAHPLVPTLYGRPVWVIAQWMTEATLCVVAYAMTALLIRRKLFGGRIPSKNTWAIALALFFLGAVVPPLVCLAFFNNDPHFNSYFEIATTLNPFPMTDVDIRVARTALLMLWTLAIVLANFGWLNGMFSRFHRRTAGAASVPAEA